MSTPQPQEFLTGEDLIKAYERRREALVERVAVGERVARGVTPELNAALAKAQIEIGRAEIKRDRRVTVVPKDAAKEPYSYSYATLASISNLALPILGANRLSFACLPGAASDGKGLSIRYSLRHESGETLDGEWPIAGAENIQTLGGRLTYLRRYILAALLGIAAEEDDDAMATMISDGQEPAGVRAQVNRGAARKPAAARSNRQATPAAAESLPGGDPATGQGDVPPRPMLNHMFGKLAEVAQLDNFQPTREQRLAGISDIVGREITSSNEMTRAEVQRVIDVTTAEIEETRPAEGDSNAGA